MVYADPGLIRNDVLRAEPAENHNRLPQAFYYDFSLSFWRSITTRLKTSLNWCFLKCLLHPVNITYDALTGLILNRDQQRAQNASAQASIFIMHRLTSPTNLSLPGMNTGDLSLWLFSLFFLSNIFHNLVAHWWTRQEFSWQKSFDLDEGFLSNYLLVLRVLESVSMCVFLSVYLVLSAKHAHKPLETYLCVDLAVQW